MPREMSYAVLGKVMRVEEGGVVFAPSNTTYELKLITPQPYAGPVGIVVAAHVRARARKLWTVASGGNFITPIQGPLRIVQGRIKWLDERLMLMQAGIAVAVELPSNDNQYDLNSGPLAVGALVNAALLPGAAFELAEVRAGEAAAAENAASSAVAR